MPLMVAMVLMAVLTIGGVAGTLMYMAKAGKLGGGAVKTVVVKEIEKPPTHALVLEPLLVNLADADGHSYLRIGVTLEEEDPPKDGKKKEEKEAKPLPGANADVRDTVLEVLGRQKGADLLAADGKEKLKAELKAKLLEHDPEAKVVQVYFTDFLVQR